MKTRQTVLDLFSTFAHLEADRVDRWIPDPHLQRSMRQAIQVHPTVRSEPEWVCYWLQRVRDSTGDRTPYHHLSAYLQEPCYWVAQKISQRFPLIACTVADSFQMASAEISRVIQSYKADRGSQLKTYASLVLLNFLKDHLRQRREVDVCSDWAFLRKVSKKRIRETLQHMGMHGEMAESYEIAWTCFMALYVPQQAHGTEQLGKPNAASWRAIADLYQRMHLGHSLTPEQLEAMLLKLTRWVRSYVYPKLESLNRPKLGYDSGEIQDDVMASGTETLLDQAIADEEETATQEKLATVQTILTDALQRLDADSQQILQFFYRDNLSQVELADRTGLSQPTVSRRLKKGEEILLKALLDWVAPQVNELPTPTELKYISSLLKEWLLSHYQSSGRQTSDPLSPDPLSPDRDSPPISGSPAESVVAQHSG